MSAGTWRRNSPWLTLALLAAIQTCGFIDRILMNVLAQPIKLEFGLTDLEVALLAGLAFAVLNAVLGIWVARVAERRERMPLIWIGTLLWSVATAACGAETGRDPRAATTAATACALAKTTQS